jgi:urease accessory protein
MSLPTRPLLYALSLCAAALPLAAAAHTGADAGAHHGLAAGLLHPFTGLDHLATMLAVGVWGGSTATAPGRGLRERRLWALPVTFAACLLTGALLAASGLNLPAVEPMIAASLLVLGLLLATRQPLPAVWSAALVGGFALFHGAAHGQELAGGAAMGGMLLGSVLLQATGLGLGRALQGGRGLLPRLAGLAVALFGGALLLA